MKKGVVLIITCLILLLMAPITLAIFAFSLPPQYDAAFLGELKHKYETLREIPEQRIIVIGGSSVAFGQDSELIEEELPRYKVINFGMYAGLGSTVMLDLVKPYIHEGDIIIFSPEQSKETLSMYFNSEAMWQAADGEYQMLFTLPKNKLGAMLGQFGYFAVNKFNYYRNHNAPSPTGVYQSSSFDNYGDIAYERRQNIMIGGVDPNTPIRFDRDMIAEEFIRCLNTFAAVCDERGARFYYRFCPMNASAVSTEDRNESEAYYRYLQSKLKFRIIGELQNSILEKEWFYDTNFHLNDAGTIVNTKALVTDLKKELMDTSPTEIVLPQMPEAVKYEVIKGDNSDQDCFLYERSNNEIRLVGLTEEGKQKERLILPIEYEGYPVTAFSPGLFAGNSLIREIIIQSNIRRIENESFVGCSSLQRLILMNPQPEECTVSDKLLTGTDCNIYVPQQYLSVFMTSYFWSIYSERLFGNPDGSSMPTGTEKAMDITVTDTTEDEEVITYQANGGIGKDKTTTTVIIPMTTGHLRTNTALGTQLFEREGYVPVGWNTKADGTGEAVGFGSRINRRKDLTLYAQWEKALDRSDFEYDITDGEIRITKYLGSDRVIAVPERVEGLPVRRICSGAFYGAEIDTLVLPFTIFAVERGAFTGSSVCEIYLYDSLYYIYDDSFEGCVNLSTLHINAATPPVYSGSYFDTFSDKFDWLLSIKDQKKIVLFSGSSGRFGYDSPAVMKAFPEYQVANMGVYAYTNALPQLRIIKSLMKQGDILISAPEFDTVKNQFCTTNSVDPLFFAMLESNYDAVSLLDLRDYSKMFDSLSSYLTKRSNMGGKSYSISAKNYDDEGRRYDYETYNIYGDFILKRPNGEKDELLQTYLADYTVSAFPEGVIQSMNQVYREFLETGIHVYFSYAPRNHSSITTDSTLSARRDLQAYLTDRLCVPVISDIEDYLYSGIFFYLIDNHLSDRGVQMRTEQIIKDISAQFAKEQESSD